MFLNLPKKGYSDLQKKYYVAESLQVVQPNSKVTTISCKSEGEAFLAADPQKADDFAKSTSDKVVKLPRWVLLQWGRNHKVCSQQSASSRFVVLAG